MPRPSILDNKKDVGREAAGTDRMDEMELTESQNNSDNSTEEIVSRGEDPLQPESPSLVPESSILSGLAKQPSVVEENEQFSGERHQPAYIQFLVMDTFYYLGPQLPPSGSIAVSAAVSQTQCQASDQHRQPSPDTPLLPGESHSTPF